MRERGVWNVYFTYEMKDLRMKINFTHEIFILHMELKQFAYETFSSVKLHVKSL